jgi:hypothetical protein
MKHSSLAGNLNINQTKGNCSPKADTSECKDQYVDEATQSCHVLEQLDQSDPRTQMDQLSVCFEMEADDPRRNSDQSMIVSGISATLQTVAHFSRENRKRGF